MNKTRILYVGMSDNIGGIETYLINIYRHIDKERFDIRFMVFCEKPCFYDEIADNLVVITPREKNYFRYLREIKQHYQNHKYDYIHFHLMSFSLFEPIIYAQKYTDARLILHSHISNSVMAPLTKMIHTIGERQILKKQNYIKLACSEVAGKSMFADFRDPSFTVMNNGVDVEKYSFDNDARNRIRNQLHIPDDTVVLGHVGRMSEQKNHKGLIEIYSAYHKANPESVLLLIGKGELEESIRKQVQESGIENSVIFTGAVSNVNEYLSAMDVFLLPSLWEGLPFVLVEAQANGLLCIASEEGVTKEAELTPTMHFCSLKNTDEWIRCISGNTHDHQAENEKYIRDSQYSVINTTKILERLYGEESE